MESSSYQKRAKQSTNQPLRTYIAIETGEYGLDLQIIA
jgi:hypothetical protein